MKVRHSQLLPTTGCNLAAFELGNKLKRVGDDDDNYDDDDDDVDGDVDEFYDDVDDVDDDDVGANHRLLCCSIEALPAATWRHLFLK